MSERSRGYSGNSLLVAAAQGGVTLASTEIQEIRFKSRLAAAIDDVADESYRGNTVEDFLRYVEPKNFEACMRFVEERGGITQLLSAVDTLVELGNSKRDAPDIDSYVHALLQEAMYFADQFALSEEGPELPQRQNFNKWLSAFSAGGYYVDAAVDMTKDHNNGTIRLAPSLRGRSQLLNLASRSLVESTRYIRGTRLLLAIGATSLTTVLRSSQR